MKRFPLASRHLLILTGLALVSLLTGCASYQLGSPTELPFQKIYVKPVSNDSFAPQAQALVSSELRQAFIRDGRSQIVSSEEAADAVLLVNLTDYSRQAVSRERDDTTEARDFDLTLVAQVSLFDQNTGDYFFQNRRIEDRSNAYVENPFRDAKEPNTQDLIQAEYNAMPRLARDLARKIADEVLSPWPTKVEEAAAAQAEVTDQEVQEAQ